jgi:Rad3-related DNA helicase
MNIKFPIEPYQIQTDFAKTLYEALESQVKLCFMESPTGTGKSYSLLVGLCSWL